MHGCPSTEACQRSDHKNFVVTNRGFPIDPDYNIMTRPSADSFGSQEDLSKRRSGGPNYRNDNCNTPIFSMGSGGRPMTSRPKTSIGKNDNFFFFQSLKVAVKFRLKNYVFPFFYL